jgi:hypothetical protein
MKNHPTLDELVSSGTALPGRFRLSDRYWLLPSLKTTDDYHRRHAAAGADASFEPIYRLLQPMCNGSRLNLSYRPPFAWARNGEHASVCLWCIRIEHRWYWPSRNTAVAWFQFIGKLFRAGNVTSLWQDLARNARHTVSPSMICLRPRNGN